MIARSGRCVDDARVRRRELRVVGTHRRLLQSTARSAHWCGQPAPARRARAQRPSFIFFIHERRTRERVRLEEWTGCEDVVDPPSVITVPLVGVLVPAGEAPSRLGSERSKRIDKAILRLERFEPVHTALLRIGLARGDSHLMQRRQEGLLCYSARRVTALGGSRRCCRRCCRRCRCGLAALNSKLTALSVPYPPPPTPPPYPPPSAFDSPSRVSGSTRTAKRAT